MCRCCTILAQTGYDLLSLPAWLGLWLPAWLCGFSFFLLQSRDKQRYGTLRLTSSPHCVAVGAVHVSRFEYMPQLCCLHTNKSTRIRYAYVFNVDKYRNLQWFVCVGITLVSADTPPLPPTQMHPTRVNQDYPSKLKNYIFALRRSLAFVTVIVMVRCPL